MNSEIITNAYVNALQKLDSFTGHWNTEGVTVDGIVVRATDTYEWLAGKHFLMHKWNSELGDTTTEGIEIIGFDSDAGEYFTQSFDSLGNKARYRANLSGKMWFIDGETERFIGKFSSNYHILSGRWEILDNGTWKPWMEIKLTKEGTR